MQDAPDSPLAQVLFLFTGTSPTACPDAAEDVRTAETAPARRSPRAAGPSPSAAGPVRRPGRPAA
ncbi:hypothetical protein ACFCYX_30330 [Streptomyces populi]|uniref:hypothetical protein n=1 Tax=Streptomyces populi TaxID=2058924 RepID=UPI0013A6D29C|nr:hypothetical protein [Streptomyces populi]